VHEKSRKRSREKRSVTVLPRGGADVARREELFGRGVVGHQQRPPRAQAQRQEWRRFAVAAVRDDERQGRARRRERGGGASPRC
jgi:hypothetical protein